MGAIAPRRVGPGADLESIAGRLVLLAGAVEKGLSAIEKRDTPRAIHDTRVAVRRFRAALRNLKGELPPRERRRCMGALLAVIKACNAVRDADVRERLVGKLLPRTGLGDHQQARTLLAAAAKDGETVRLELRRRMATPKWSDLLWDLRQSAVALTGSHGSTAQGGELRSVLERQRRRLRRHLAWRGRKPRQLHRLRLRIKDARYFVEDFGPLLGATSGRDDVPQLRELQKALGDFHDEWRLRKWLRTQYKSYLVTDAMRVLLKTRERKLLKKIRRLQRAIRRREGRGAGRDASAAKAEAKA